MSTGEASEMPFDEVIIVGPPERRLAPREFFALPLALRLRHVIAHTATFLREGASVDPQIALAQKQFCPWRHAGRDRRREVVFCNDGERPHNREDVPKIVTGGTRRNRDGDPARGNDGEIKGHQIGVIEHEHGHAVARIHAGLAQAGEGRLEARCGESGGSA